MYYNECSNFVNFSRVQVTTPVPLNWNSEDEQTPSRRRAAVKSRSDAVRDNEVIDLEGFWRAFVTLEDQDAEGHDDKYGQTNHGDAFRTSSGREPLAEKAPHRDCSKTSAGASSLSPLFSNSARNDDFNGSGQGEPNQFEGSGRSEPDRFECSPLSPFKGSNGWESGVNPEEKALNGLAVIASKSSICRLTQGRCNIPAHDNRAGDSSRAARVHQAVVWDSPENLPLDASENGLELPSRSSYHENALGRSVGGTLPDAGKDQSVNTSIREPLSGSLVPALLPDMDLGTVESLTHQCGPQSRGVQTPASFRRRVLSRCQPVKVSFSIAYTKTTLPDFFATMTIRR